MRIRPARRIKGALSLPGDKAISHRASIIGALCEGASRIENFSTGDDCRATLSCLRDLGVSVELEAGVLRIEGVGLEGLRAPSRALDCRNSGTTMRMLAGVLAGQSFDSILTGDESLRQRPMRRIIEPLRLMGARVESSEGRAPLLIKGSKRLKAISYEMPVASAQVKSCIMLAGLYASGRTRVIEPPASTRDHTERMLRLYGASVKEKGAHYESDTRATIEVEPRPQLHARDFSIPGDISSAAFFIAAAALLPGSQLVVKDVSLNPTRTQFLSTMCALGADIRLATPSDWLLQLDYEEPRGDLSVTGGAGLLPIKENGSRSLSGPLIPRLIDELPVLAVLGTQVEGGLTIRDAAELRLKETDRIAATVENLRVMGARVEEHEDGLTVQERTPLRGAKIKAHGDHRIAMAFSVAALLAEGDSEIEDAECASISFPEFYNLLESLVER